MYDEELFHEAISLTEAALTKVKLILHFPSNHMDDDLRQEGYLAVLESLGDYRGDSQASTWGFTIIFRSMMRYMAKELHAPVCIGLLQDLEVFMADNSLENLPLEAAIASETLEQYFENLETPEAKLVIILGIWGGYTLEEIAQVTDMSTSSASRLLKTARAVYEGALDES